MRETVLEVIREAVHEALEGRGDVQGAALEEDTVLFGEGGLLDSMGLVTAVVAVEQALADRHGLVVSLADERALSRRNSPYRTVGTLADYTLELIGPAAP
ncbi:MAG: hypothetical protein KatS3mg121_0300 [Gammaproteobacteria bacterium]|nr:MAG: hypothetical protein KatS3mg121_0300 [Gammaproteobacteria bacterium]